MRHIIIYTGILVVMMASCSQSPKGETAHTSDTLHLGVSSEELGVESADTVASEKAEKEKGMEEDYDEL